MQRLWADLARGLNCSASRTNKYRNGDIFRKRSVASDPVASDVDQRRRPGIWRFACRFNEMSADTIGSFGRRPMESLGVRQSAEWKLVK